MRASAFGFSEGSPQSCFDPFCSIEQWSFALPLSYAGFVKTRLFAKTSGLCLFVASLAGFFGACDSEPDLSDPEEAGEALGDAFCGYLAGCCDEAVLPGGSESSCAEQIRLNFGLLIDQAEQDGYTYDPRCVEQQIAALDGATCSISGANGVPEDGSCYVACAGIAHGSVQEGEVCEDPRDCDYGLVCVGTCVNPCGAGLGEACGQLSETSFVSCAAGTFCASETVTAPGVCSKLPGAGEPCSGFGCAAGLACDGSVCGAPIPNGSPCPGFMGCASGFCDTTDFENPVCKALPGPGEPCTFACSPEATCDGTTCIALPESGEPCPDFQCAPNLACSDNVCRSESELLCGIFDGD